MLLGTRGTLFGTSALTLMYLLLGVLALRRLLWLEAATKAEMNTKKLFVMTCFLVATMRFMSFASITILDLQTPADYEADSSATTAPTSVAGRPRTPVLPSTDSAALDVFFDKANLVLFDLPDFCIVSAYVLLLVVWAEAFLKSRRHWLSTSAFRRLWLWGYLAFNTALYSVQLTLYSMLFWPQTDQAVLSFWISLALSTINLCLPLVWLLSYLYLSFVLGGFPFSSPAAKLRLATLSTVGAVWTLSRVGWGFLALSSTLQGWLVDTAYQRGELYSVLLVVIFLLAEGLPLALSLQESTIQSLAAAVRAQSVSFVPGIALTTRSQSAYTNYVFTSGGDRSDREASRAGGSSYQAAGNLEEDDEDYVLDYGAAAGGASREDDPRYLTPPRAKKLSVVPLDLITTKSSPHRSPSGTAGDGSPSIVATSGRNNIGSGALPKPLSVIEEPALRREIPAPSQSALSALRAQQGKALVGRPMPADRISERYPPYAAVRLNIDEISEWSGESGGGEAARPAGDGQRLMDGGNHHPKKGLLSWVWP